MDVKPPFSGAVKEYSMESYVCDEEGKEILDYKYTWKYNQNNQISEIFHYDSKNELANISYYTYDNDQNLIDVTVETVEGTKKQSLVYEYKDNKLSQITDNSLDFQIITKFDDRGNPLEKHNLADADSQFSTTKYINLYDQNNRLVEKHTVFPSGVPNWIDKYKYNSEGLLIEEQRIKGQVISIVKHSYNDKGDLILSEYNPHENNNETLKKEIVYDEDKDIVEIKEYRKGWCYQNFNDEFGLTGIARYSYIR
jgi:hypothetical protein